MSRALVLSGGGSRGAFEAGAVEYLVEKAGLDFTFFCGSSAGALNSGLLGQARTYRELREQSRRLTGLWLEIKNNRSIYQKSCLGVFNLLLKDALYNPVGLRNLIATYVDPNRLIANPAKFIKVATVAVETGELFLADSRNSLLGGDLNRYILASASLPLFFPPVFINNKHWFDGGLRDITPLGAAFAETPREIMIILTYPVDDRLAPLIKETGYRGAIPALARAVEIMANEISANDLQLALLINRYYRIFPGKRRIPIYLITPPTALSGDPLDFDPPKIREYIEMGRAAAAHPRLVTDVLGGRGSTGSTATAPLY